MKTIHVVIVGLMFCIYSVGCNEYPSENTQSDSQSDTQETNERWGLSMEQRKEIFDKIGQAETKAQNEADQKIPIEAGATESTIIQNIDLMREIQKDLLSGLAIEYGIDTAIIDSIRIEGVVLRVKKLQQNK